MKKRYSDHDKPMDDAVLHYFLRRHDPVASPSPIFLAALEEDILAEIDVLKDDLVSQAPLLDNGLPTWMLPQGWTARAAALAAMLIVATGFIIGQVSYEGANISSLSNGQSLLAFADEPLMHYIPTTDASGGDNNDDDE